MKDRRRCHDVISMPVPVAATITPDWSVRMASVGGQHNGQPRLYLATTLRVHVGSSHPLTFYRHYSTAIWCSVNNTISTHVGVTCP